MAKLEDSFDLLASNPQMGRGCGEIRARLRHFEIERHIVFYENREDAVFIVRVLHQAMLAAPVRFEL